MTAFNENVTVIEELWVFLDPNRRKAGERLLSTLLLLPALPKHGITDTVLQLFGVFPTAQLFQPTETRHRKQQPNEIPISWIVWWALDCCGSQSWGPASLTPCLREPALLLGQHSEPAQGTGSCSCFSQKSHFPAACIGLALAAKAHRQGELWYLASAHHGDTHQLSCFQLTRAHFQQDRQ